MSRDPDLNAILDLDVDAILEEFHRQESEAAPAPKRASPAPRPQPPGPVPEPAAPAPRPAAPEPVAPEPVAPEPVAPEARPAAPKPRSAAPEPAATEPWPAPPKSKPAAPPVEGTVLYETKPAEETALYQASPVGSHAPAAAKSAVRPQRAPASPAKPAPDYLPRAAAPAKGEKRSHGLGFALMFVVLLLLAAALAVLLRWSSHAEKGEEQTVPEPELIRLDLGQGLEHFLDSESGKYR